MEIERAFRRIWPNTDWADFGRTFDRWVSEDAYEFTQRARREAARLGGAYFAAFRVAEGIRGGARTARLATLLDREQFRIGMRATALVSLTRARDLAENAEDEARAALYLKEGREKAFSSTLGSVVRHALNGDRETVLESIRTDRYARGYTRIVESGACNFCEMLAGRGAVYDADSGEFEAHDDCNCSAEASFS